MAFTVLIEGHDGDTARLLDAHLDVDPGVEGQKDGLGRGLVHIILSVDVDAERRRGVVEQGENLVKLDHVVILAACKRTGREGVLAEVLHPEGESVANVATLELEARDVDVGEFAALTLVELRHLVELL